MTDQAATVAQHTPGPWEVLAYDASVAYGPFIRRVGSKHIVASTFVSATFRPEHMTHEELLANARLIAAAPELLEALKEFVSLGQFAGVRKWGKVQNKAIAAIAKAEGRES